VSRWRGPHQRGSLRSRRQICFAPCAGWLTGHVRQHPREVGSLSRGVMSPQAQLPSGPLQAGLRFLPRPLPAAPSARLAAGLPSREDDGLTTLHRRNPRGLGPAFTPVALHLRRGTLQPPDLATYRFGPSLSAPLAASIIVSATVQPFRRTIGLSRKALLRSGDQIPRTVAETMIKAERSARRPTRAIIAPPTPKMSF